MEDGEKNTKYFLNLEKRNYNSTCIKKQKVKNEQEITNVKDIILEQENFYKELYSPKLEDNQSTTLITNKFINSEHIPLLDQLDKDLCDSEITLEECSKALKELANNKSTGSDGFTTNFNKIFWPDIKFLVYESYAYSLTHNLLTQEQRLGIINLILKKDKDLRYLKNWRPVLNTDYKIIAKTLANRLHKVIAKIIDEDQVGYIKGRPVHW